VAYNPPCFYFPGWRQSGQRAALAIDAAGDVFISGMLGGLSYPRRRPLTDRLMVVIMEWLCTKLDSGLFSTPKTGRYQWPLPPSISAFEARSDEFRPSLSAMGANATLLIGAVASDRFFF